MMNQFSIQRPISFFVFSLCSLFFTSNLCAQGSATVLSGSADFSLLYTDGISRPQPAAIGVYNNAAHVPDNMHAERGMGLRHAKIDLSLETQNSSKLQILLRPDAINTRSDVVNEIPRETDTRAGDTYHSVPDIRLLDAYQITVRPGTGMSMSIGVWETLSLPSLAYEQILQPGLDVMLPAKFSGLRLRWNKFQPLDPANIEKRQKGIVSDFYIIQGDRDRVEKNYGSKAADDHAPGAHDPHYGGALVVNWLPADQWSLQITGGSLSSEDASGKVNNVFSELNAIWRYPGLLQGLTSSLMVKQSKETFRDTPAPIDDRLNQSVSVLFALGVVPGSSFLAGASYGVGEWPEDELKPFDNGDFSGNQFEIGFQNSPGKDLLLQGMIVQERRLRKDPGAVEVGGFVTGDSRSKEIRRLALQLSYQMSGIK
jgi:hypothetical protein